MLLFMEVSKELIELESLDISEIGPPLKKVEKYIMAEGLSRVAKMMEELVEQHHVSPKLFCGLKLLDCWDKKHH